jgi:hypothetical protein
MSLIGDATRGAIAGAAATWAMDQVTTVMLTVQAPEVTKQETAALANGKSSVSNLVDRVEAETGLVVSKKNRPIVETVTHYALGAVPGALYGILRHIPGVRAGSGLFYGLGVFALNDEYLNTKLGLASAPSAYPPETHIRGLAGHAVLGVATETGIQLLGG